VGGKTWPVGWARISHVLLRMRGREDKGKQFRKGVYQGLFHKKKDDRGKRAGGTAMKGERQAFLPSRHHSRETSASRAGSRALTTKIFWYEKKKESRKEGRAAPPNVNQSGHVSLAPR